MSEPIFRGKIAGIICQMIREDEATTGKRPVFKNGIGNFAEITENVVIISLHINDAGNVLQQNKKPYMIISKDLFDQFVAENKILASVHFDATMVFLVIYKETPVIVPKIIHKRKR